MKTPTSMAIAGNRADSFASFSQLRDIGIQVWRLMMASSALVGVWRESAQSRQSLAVDDSQSRAVRHR